VRLVVGELRVEAATVGSDDVLDHAGSWE
jgi:hypothetical protein